MNAATAATVSRVPASEIEELVLKTLREQLHLTDEAMSAADIIRDHVARVDVRADRLIVQLLRPERSGVDSNHDHQRVEISWRKTAKTRRREILLPDGAQGAAARPIPPKAVHVSSPRSRRADAGSMSSPAIPWRA